MSPLVYAHRPLIMECSCPNPVVTVLNAGNFEEHGATLWCVLYGLIQRNHAFVDTTSISALAQTLYIFFGFSLDNVLMLPPHLMAWSGHMYRY